VDISDHVNVLGHVYTVVSEKLEAQSVARNMFQCNAITLKELQSIQCKRCESVTAAERLMNIVLNQSRTVYGFFMNALKLTDQRNVYDIIINGSYKGKTKTLFCIIYKKTANNLFNVV